MSQINVNAQSGKTGLLSWSISDSTLTISGSGAMPDYTFSSAAPWSSYQSNITTIIIGDSVMSIGNYAFYNCSSLTSITISNSVTNIGHFAFGDCSGLNSITIPNNVTTIGGSAFNSCSGLTSFTISNSVTNIANFTFQDCSALTSITIPNNVKSIGLYAFANCSNLTTVNFNADSCYSINDANSLLNCWQGCSSLTTINIGNNVKWIPDFAFKNCSSLTSITIPESVTIIGRLPFLNCTSLDTANFNAINCISYSSIFATSTLKVLNIGNHVKKIPNDAFSSCGNLTTVNFNADSCISMNSNFNTINNYWRGCDSLTTINIGDNVKRIPDNAFPDCSKVTSIIIPNSVTNIGRNAFNGCSNITSITIPNGITSIGVSAFSNCSNLTTVNFNADSCISIEYSGLEHCSLLTTINIGNNVKWLPNNAFYNLNKLTSITVNATVPPKLRPQTFYNVSDSIPIYIPCFSYDNYSNDSLWSKFTNFVANGAVDTTFYAAIKCHNIPYIDDNFTSPIDSAGVYCTQLANGTDCDEIICLTLAENPYIPVTNYHANICNGAFYSDNLFTNLTEEGYYYDTLQSVNGCDSIICLNLNYYPTIPLTSYSANLCHGASYSDDLFTNLTESGYYYDTLQSVTGCDSVIVLNLTFTVSLVPELCMVSADENNHNEIVWQQTDAIVSYNLYREGNVSGTYDLVTNIDYNNTNRWVDTTSNAKARSYRYRIAGIDTCGNESALSSIHKTMHLTINAGVNNSWNLIWTPYEGTNYSTYNIYRSTEDGNWELIGAMPSGNTSYTDFSAPTGYVYYMIEIMIDNPCILAKRLSSIKSNVASNNPNVGIVETQNAATLQIFPNPTSGQLRIESGEWRAESGKLKAESVEVFDIMGRKQYAEIREMDGGVLLNIAHLSAGVYIVKVGGVVGRVVKN